VRSFSSVFCYAFFCFFAAACGSHTDKVESTAVSSPQASYAWLRENVFIPKCVGCHGTQGAKDLNLITYDSLRRNGDAVRPGSSSASHLFIQVRDGLMPKPDRTTGKSNKLDPAVIDVIGKWIDNGAANN
jgi:hypothetical protein